MAGAGSAVKAGGAYVEFFIQDKISRQLSAIGKKISNAGMGVAKAGAGLAAGAGAVATPFLAMTKQFADMGDNLHKMSARTGVGVQALSELGHAAELSGTDLETVGGAIQKMNRRIGRMTAGQGSSTQVAAMQELGLSLDELSKMNPEQQFMALADAMEGYGNQAQAAGLAQRAFGTEVDQLLPLFADGSQGMRDMMKEARDLGITLTDADANAAAGLTDALARVKSTIKGVALQMGAALAPAITSAAEWMGELVAKIVRFVKSNREMVVTVAKGVAIVGAIGAGLAALGLTVSAVGGGIAALATLVSGSFAVITGVLGAVLSPIGIVVAAVGGLTAAWATMTESGRQTITGLLTWFGQLKDFAIDTWGGIADALKAGDLALAAKIAWTSLKLIWEQGVQYLMGIWNSFTDMAITVFDHVITWIRKTWTKLTGWLGEQVAKVIALFTGEDPGAMADAVQQATDAQVDELQRERAAREKERQAAADARAERNAEQLEKLRQERNDALAEARELARQDSTDTPELARAKKEAQENAQDGKDQALAKQARLDSVEFGLEAFKRFEENRQGIEQKQYAETVRIRKAVERGGVQIAEAGS